MTTQQVVEQQVPGPTRPAKKMRTDEADTDADANIPATRTSPHGKPRAPKEKAPSRCLCIEGLPSELDESAVRVLLTERGVPEPEQVRKIHARPVAYVGFKSIEEKDTARALLQDNTLTILDARDFTPPSRKQRKLEKLAAAAALLPEHERLNDKVTPLWRKSYPEQLAHKQKLMEGVVAGFAEKLRSVLDQQGSGGDAYKSTCPSTVSASVPPLLPVVASPDDAIYHYRNKCEFSTGLDASKTNITLGFMMGLYREGTVAVSSPQQCLHVAPAAKRIVAWMQTYLAEVTAWSVYDRVTHAGNWRLVMTRTQKRSGDVMVLLQVHPQGKTVEECAAEKAKVTQYLLDKAQAAKSETNNGDNGDGELDGPVSLTTILWQESDSCNNCIPESVPVEVVHGPGRITEHLHMMQSADGTGETFTFDISPFSFFQSSTLACERLYDLIAQWSIGEGACGESNVATDVPNAASTVTPRKKLLLDLCCGTGTIGITMSRLPSIHKIIGIELCAQALDDAKRNAKLNNVASDRVEYICDKVEVALPGVLDKLKTEQGLEDVEVVAVLDPPRAGVHKSVIQAIRAAPFIDRLIYVSCNPNAASQNWFELCKPADRKFVGEPFQLRRAQPVDMFPHTEHCELVLEFARGKAAADMAVSGAEKTGAEEDGEC